LDCTVNVLDQLEELWPLFEADKKKKNAEAAAFSPFGQEYIKLDENMSSNILADLLDPDGKHSQGYFFLKRFTRLPPLRKKGVNLAGEFFRIQREAHTEQGRRMDIRIHCSSGILGVESKIWAGDQNEQLEAYLRSLQTQAAAAECKYWLLYLTPDGRKPPKNSLPQGELWEERVICLAWPEVLTWLSRCCKNTRMLAKLKFFLLDFITAMHNKGIYTENAHMDNNMIKKISSKREYFDAARECHRLYPAIVAERISVWSGKTYAILKKNDVLSNLVINPIDNLKIEETRWRPICVNFQECPCLKAGIMFKERMGKAPGIFVQLELKENKGSFNDYRKKIHEYLVDELKCGGGHNYYCWWKEFENKPWNDWGQYAALEELIYEQKTARSAGAERPEALLNKVCLAIVKFLNTPSKTLDELKKFGVS
jgi:hypothetical protein